MITKPTFWQRITGPTPPFWKTVRRVSVTAAAVGTAILAAPLTPGFPPNLLPDWLTNVAGYAVAISGAVAAAASATYDQNAKQ